MERIEGQWGEDLFDLIARAARTWSRAEVVHNGEVLEVPADIPWLPAVKWLSNALARYVGQIAVEVEELRAEVVKLKAEVASLQRVRS